MVITIYRIDGRVRILEYTMDCHRPALDETTLRAIEPLYKSHSIANFNKR